MSSVLQRSAFGWGWLGGFFRKASAVTTLIEDAFTDTNATTLDLHTIAPTNTPATAWTVKSGSWQILTNLAGMTASATNATIHCNPGVSACTVYADLPVLGAQLSSAVNRYQGVIGRGNAGMTAYWFIAIDQYSGTLNVVEFSTVRASVATTVTSGGWIKAIFSGTTITALDSTGATVSYTSSNTLTETLAGLRNYAATSRFDNFKVTVP